MQKTSHIYGLRAVIEAIEANKSVNRIFLQQGLKGALFKELEALIRNRGISSSYVPLERLNRITKNNHQGVVASISPIEFQDFGAMVESIVSQKKNSFFLILDHITDVRNFGAIIRTAECCGVDGIIVPKTGAAPITEDTVKTSAGAVFNIPIAKVDHLKDAIYYLQASGIKVIAASEKADKCIYDVELNSSIAIVMGSEGKGISPSVLKLADSITKLPLSGKIGSLNVSVACGVFLYEVVRQRLS